MCNLERFLLVDPKRNRLSFCNRTEEGGVDTNAIDRLEVAFHTASNAKKTDSLSSIIPDAYPGSCVYVNQ
jgi:hypothetical protein